MVSNKIILIHLKNLKKNDSYSNKTFDEILTHSIIVRLKNSSNKNVAKIGIELEKDYKKKHYKRKISSLIYNLVRKISDSGNIKKHIKLSIPDSKYQQLIVLKKKGLISLKDSKLLDKLLFNKVCHCVNKRINRMTADWLLGKEKEYEYNQKNNPYAICTYSIYNRRGFKRNLSFKKCNIEK